MTEMSNDDDDDGDTLFTRWDSEEFQDVNPRSRDGLSLIAALAHAAADLGSKAIEDPGGLSYVYYAVAALVVVVWLVNALLCVGLWRVPTLHSTMRIKPSTGEQSKWPVQAKPGPDISLLPGSKRRRRSRAQQDPQKADSTIATVTVFIEGGGGGAAAVEEVKVLHSTPVAAITPAAAAAAVDTAETTTTTTTESLESEESQEATDSQQEHAPPPGDPHSNTPNTSTAKSACKTREHSFRGKAGTVDALLQAVYDLDDRSSLPPEIIDLLACRGGDLCFHDHGRCRVVNNKLYISAKPRDNDRRKLSESHRSSARHNRCKKVSFSAVAKHRHPTKVKDAGTMLPSFQPDLIPTDASAQPVPPPPRGYHVRADPSSPDSSSEILLDEDSAWTRADQDSLTANNHSEAPQALDQALVPRPQQKRRQPMKEMKENFKKAVSSSPQRLAGSSWVKIKRRGLDIERVASGGGTSVKPKCYKTACEVYGCGAFGDSVCNSSPNRSQMRSPCKMKLGNIETVPVIAAHCVRTDSENSIGRICHNTKPMRETAKSVEVSNTKYNRARLRHTIRDKQNANNNKNSSHKYAMFLRRTGWHVDTRSLPTSSGNNVSVLGILNVSALFYLNTNMNACCDDKGVPTSSPEDEQQAESTVPNVSSSPSSGDVFYTPAPGSPESRPVVSKEAQLRASGAADSSAENCHQLEGVLPGSKTFNSPVQSQVCVSDKLQDDSTFTESELEGWEAKKHNIMMACNEAIKNRLQRQEFEEEESRDVTTTSDSTSFKQPGEGKKRKKTKTTESVYVKFKTSLSKKMTTTTTMKEVKQSMHGGTTKPLMVENDHKNALCLTAQSSDQSLSAPQPRLTRIIKCGEMEVPIRKRNQCSDTEIEFLYMNDADKQQTGVANRQINQKENTYVETSAMEDHSLDMDRQEMASLSQRSPQQYPSIGNGEMIAEHDKVSEKASAITVINVTEASQMSHGQDEVLSPENAGSKGSGSSPGQPGSENDLFVNPQSGSATVQAPKGKERVKRRSKSHTPRQVSSKKKSELKRVSSKPPVDVLEPMVKEVARQQVQSETSLSNEPKKVTPTSSSSKASKHCDRSHSSPPECRKKKGDGKKRSVVHLVEPLEGGSRRGRKSRKKSPDKRKKARTGALREERPRKTGSASSTSSEKKRKSQTTASSISIDSMEGRSQVLEQSPPKQELVLSSVEMNVPDLSKPKKSPKLFAAKKETPQKKVSRKRNSQKQKNQQPGHQKGDAKDVEKREASEEEKLPTPVPTTSDIKVNEDPAELPHSPPENFSVAPKPMHKVTTKFTQAKAFIRSRSGEKDLQKAEMGWNNSICYSGPDKGNTVGEKQKTVPKRHRLKYVLVKAKDKNVEKEIEKDQKPKPQADAETKKSPVVASSQDFKQDGQGDTSQRGQGKTVQFSESIDKIEDLKQTDILEEGESIEEQAQENHIGDNASDGSLGDLFLTDNFDLVRELVEEEEEEEELDKKPELPEPEPKVESEPEPEPEKPKSVSPRRHRRPVWLKKAAPKPLDEPAVDTMVVTAKRGVSPKRLEKRKDSIEEVLKSKRCNIQVTYPLVPAGTSVKGEQASPKTKVAYSSLLSSIFLALPLQKTAKRMIAQSGSPVDIKEVTEGSSVDAADYAKALRYSPKVKRSTAMMPAAPLPVTAKRKKLVTELKGVLAARASRDMLGESGSARSLLSRDSEADRRLATPNCSFSTDLDEATVYKQRPVQSAHTNRSSTRKVPCKKEKRPMHGQAMMKGRGAAMLPWHLVRRVSDQSQDSVSPSGTQQTELSELRVAGDMMDTGILNVGLSWVMQEVFNRFDFLNPRRHLRTGHRLPVTVEHSLEPALIEQTYRSAEM